MAFDPNLPNSQQQDLESVLGAIRGNETDLNDRLKTQEDLSLASTKNEVVAARGSRATLNERLNVALDAQGNVKFDSLKNMTWIASGDVPTYVNAQSFTVPGDQSTKYLSGLVLRLMHGTTQIHSVVSVASYVAATDKTTVSLQQALLTPALSSVLIGLASLGEVLYENAINRMLDPLDRIGQKPMPRGAVFPMPGRRHDSIIQPDIRGTTARRTDKFNKLSQVSADVLRQEYERGILIGWMIEGQRQNVAINSNTALGGYGYSSGGNRDFGYTSGLSFPFDICGKVSKAVSGISYLYHQHISPVPGKAYIFSMMVRYEDGRDVGAQFGAPDIESSPLNPFTIVIFGVTRTWSQVDRETYSDGSVRISCTRIPTDTLVRGCGVLIRDTHKEITSPLLVTAFQIEPDASFPSSYMPTGSSPVIRDADKVRTLTSDLPEWRNGDDFSHFQEFTTGIGIDGPQYFCAYANSSGSNSVHIFRDTTASNIGMAVRVENINQAFLVIPTAVPGKHLCRAGFSVAKGKVIFTLAVQDINLGNGFGEPVSVGGDVDCVVPEGLDYKVIGNRYLGDRAAYIIDGQNATFPFFVPKSDMEAMCRFP